MPIPEHQSVFNDFYPTFERVYTSAFVISNETNSIIGEIISSIDDNSFSWKYPISDGKNYKYAVGYQIQVLDDNPRSRRITDIIANYINDSLEIDLSSPQLGSFSIPNSPDSPFVSGRKYKARIRTLLYSDDPEGTLNNEYFKYTLWGTISFRINSDPIAANLTINDLQGGAIVSKNSNLKFGFEFMDAEGPTYIYKIQVATADTFEDIDIIWDSKIINEGRFLGDRKFELNFGGNYETLNYGTTYYWRVLVQDGLSSEFPYSSTFETASMPTVSFLKLRNTDVGSLTDYLSSSVSLKAGSVDVEWDYASIDDAPETKYLIELVDGFGTENERVIQSFSGTGLSLTISDFPITFREYDSGLHLVLIVYNQYEKSERYWANIKTYEIPVVSELITEDIFENGAVTDETPTFSWKFNSSIGEQTTYQIQVATDVDFSTLVWDPGVRDISIQAVYAGDALDHGIGKYYVRLYGSDSGFTSDPIVSWFAYNTIPGEPTLDDFDESYPGDAAIDIYWTPSGTLDIDSDTIHYYLEYTDTFSLNFGWKYLSGPIASGTNEYSWDISGIPSGKDYGVRISAVDSYSQSTYSIGTSSKGGFEIEPHAIISPIIVRPIENEIFSSSVFIEWIENIPLSVDGYAIKYLVELSINGDDGSPIYNTVGIYGQGNTRASIDVSSLNDSTHCYVRITAIDARGLSSIYYQSEKFEIRNIQEMKDFETVSNKVYAGSSDGRLYNIKESIWEVDEDFDSNVFTFEKIDNGVSIVGLIDGKLRINCPSGTSCIFRSF